MSKLIVLFLSLIVLTETSAQVDSLLTKVEDVVEIKVLRIQTDYKKSPFSITKIATDNTNNQLLNLQENLNQVPGLFTLNANNYAQDLRVSIRGFGARSSFGIRGIKIIVDGISETTPDGQGQIDNLNLDLIDNIEIIKGPASLLYGNASGGVININNREIFDKDQITSSISYGSFGFRKLSLGATKLLGRNLFIINANNTTLSGYRDHSSYESSNLYLKSIVNFGTHNSLKLALNYTDSPTAQDPGGVNAATILDNRKSARDSNVEFDAGEAISQYKLSASLDLKLNTKSQLHSYSYYSGRSFDGKLPIEFGGQINLERSYWGNGGDYSYKLILPNAVFTYKLGYDMGFQSDHRQRFNNNLGQKGQQSLNQIEKFENVAFYIINRLELHNWLFDFGVRYDNNTISIDDLFFLDEDQSDNFSINAFNPSLGMNYSLSKKTNLYASFRTGFETPVLNELSANPSGQGGFNTDLKSQSSNNFEIGIRSFLFSKLNIDLNYFNINSKNELVSYRIPMFESTFYRNAGKTKRIGFELNAAYKINTAINLSFFYSISEMVFDQFEVDGVDLTGNNLPGLPRSYGGISVNGHFNCGLNFKLESLYRSGIYLNDVNSEKDVPYSLINFKFAHKIILKSFVLSPFGGINNVTNTTFNDNIRTNAFGGRYFEAGAPRNYYLGMGIKIKGKTIKNKH